jgi:hypothetical protein
MGPPDRRHPSPAAQRRRAEQWTARLGFTVLAALLLVAAALVRRLVRPG